METMVERIVEQMDAIRILLASDHKTTAHLVPSN